MDAARLLGMHWQNAHLLATGQRKAMMCAAAAGKGMNLLTVPLSWLSCAEVHI